ncbi:MAG: efflux RND transporter permease subunit [Pseudomonadota bacterium]
MKLPEICIRHPVFATVLSLLLVVIGIVGLTRLDIRFFPEINPPIITVNTKYPGAAANVVENSITTPLENALAGVNGIKSMRSRSLYEWSHITIQFNLDTNFAQAVNAVRDKISQERLKLPVNSEPSSINIGVLGQLLLSIGFTDKNKTAAEIRDYVERNVQPLLRQTSGVGWVGVYGASEYAMRIWLNAEKMADFNITVVDVTNALKNNNIEFPGGKIIDPQRQYSVDSNTLLKNPQQFADIIIKKQAGRLIRFKDIARVVVGNRSLQDAPMRINGVPGIDVEIRPLQNADPINVAKAVKKTLADINNRLPVGMQAKINYDQSIFLQASINETFKAIILAVFLVVVVVYLFLGSFRAAAIPIVTIPICLIAAFGIMYLLGFSINELTLLALVLAIGLVVDDAIVMLENIHRHVESGLQSKQAALVGSKQITLAVIAMTITLAAVYAPIGLAKGFTQIIFKQFAFTLAATVIVSGFVALTLSPMMSAYLLRHETKHSFSARLDDLFTHFSQYYQSLLSFLLKKKTLVILTLVGCAILGYAVYRSLPNEFLPKEDMGVIVTHVSAPSGASIAYTDKNMRAIEKIYAQTPAVKTYYTMVFAGNGISYAILKPWQQRQLSAQTIVAQLTAKMTAIPGINAYPSLPDTMNLGVTGSAYSVALMTAGNYQTLYRAAQNIIKQLELYPGLENVTTNLKFDTQKYKVSINRELAAELGISLKSIAETMRVMLGGAHITDFMAEGKSYPVILQMRQQDLQDLNAISKLYLKSDKGERLPLNSLVTLTPSVGQNELTHYNRLRSAVINAEVAPGYSIGEAVQASKKILNRSLTQQVSYTFIGKTQQYLDAKGNVISIFILALVFIYLILAAQFGSFIDPLIILLTVPLCIVGAIVTLKLAGGSINLYSEIGLVTLVGLVSKHGILITQFANELRQQGQSLQHAIIQAASIRLRPILMTTSAMIFGALPLALALGPGSVGRTEIGWVIVGGLLFGTLFSLIVVPVAYAIFGRLRQKFSLVN